FIKEHQGDPTVQALLDSSTARVTEILRALAAQRDYLRLMLRAMLLEERDVHHELGISGSQEEMLWKLGDQLAGQGHEVFRGSLALSENERAEKFKAMAAATEKTMAAILTNAQAKRLK